MALAITKTVELGYDVYKFANRGTEYTVLKKTGTLGGVDVYKHASHKKYVSPPKVFDSVEEFEKTAKFLKGLSLLIN